MRPARHGVAGLNLRAALFMLCAAALVLTGCDRGAPPIAGNPLPVLARPVTQLRARPQVPHNIGQGNILIPAQALVERGGIPSVFVLNQAKEARIRMVLVGHIDARGAEILSGLHGDETLVLGDLTEVHDGSPIKVK